MPERIVNLGAWSIAVPEFLAPSAEVTDQPPVRRVVMGSGCFLITIFVGHGIDVETFFAEKRRQFTGEASRDVWEVQGNKFARLTVPRFALDDGTAVRVELCAATVFGDLVAWEILAAGQPDEKLQLLVTGIVIRAIVERGRAIHLRR